MLVAYFWNISWLSLSAVLTSIHAAFRFAWSCHALKAIGNDQQMQLLQQ